MAVSTKTNGLSLGSYVKYYLKSRNENFDERYKENRAILDYPDCPVYVFVRDQLEGSFVLAGVFANRRIHCEESGAKWFELAKTFANAEVMHDPNEVQRDLSVRSSYR